MRFSYRGEDFVGSEFQAAAALQFMRKHIQQHFRIGLGVDMTQVGLIKLRLQCFNIGQVTVVRQGDSIGRIDVKRLRFG